MHVNVDQVADDLVIDEALPARENSLHVLLNGLCGDAHVLRRPEALVLRGLIAVDGGAAGGIFLRFRGGLSLLGRGRFLFLKLIQEAHR